MSSGRRAGGRAGGEVPRAHRVLLRLHPRAFREELGDAVAEMLRQRALEARASGRSGYSRFRWRELLGLVASAIREWIARFPPSLPPRAGAMPSTSARMFSSSQTTGSLTRLGTSEAVMREVRHAMRRLVRAPSFTWPALLTLALAIGLNAAIFTLVRRVVLAPLPYPNSDRLVALDHGAPGLDRPSGLGMSTGLYAHYTERAQSFESLALHTTFEMNVSGDGIAYRVIAWSMMTAGRAARSTRRESRAARPRHPAHRLRG